MNNVTIAHIGGELILMAGISFYFHKKVTTLQHEVTKLHAEHNDLAELVEEMKDVIRQLNINMQRMQQQNIFNRLNNQNIDVHLNNG